VNKRIKHFLFSAAAIGIALVVVVFVGRRAGIEPGLPALTGLSDNAAIVIDKVRQTAFRDGRTQWRLKAASARYIDSSRRALFEDIDVVFFASDGKRVHLAADRGSVDTASSDIDIQGNVVIDYDGMTLKTQTIRYQHAGRTLSSQTTVQIAGTLFSVLADGAWFDLETRQTRLGGNVKGTVYENIRL